jgi:hypothetical protein
MLHHSCQFDEEVKLRVRFGADSVCECAISKFYIIAKIFEYGTLEKRRSSVCNTGIGYEKHEMFLPTSVFRMPFCTI